MFDPLSLRPKVQIVVGSRLTDKSVVRAGLTRGNAFAGTLLPLNWWQTSSRLWRAAAVERA